MLPLLPVTSIQVRQYFTLLDVIQTQSLNPIFFSFLAEHILSIWDVRYGTLQTSTSIKNDTSSQKSKDTKSSDSHIMYKVSRQSTGNQSVSAIALLNTLLL
jgi:hypothetical protein